MGTTADSGTDGDKHVLEQMLKKMLSKDKT